MMVFRSIAEREAYEAGYKAGQAARTEAPPQSLLAFPTADAFGSYCINKGFDEKKSGWLVAWELWCKAIARSHGDSKPE